ncbi:MAG: hypothetical protein LUF87_08480, partial [Alistipes sp.]|nr:hypothetical protein [Alistipes sp.]
SREQRAESREQRAESREQIAESREQRAESREQRAGNTVKQTGGRSAGTCHLFLLPVIPVSGQEMLNLLHNYSARIKKSLPLLHQMVKD